MKLLQLTDDVIINLDLVISIKGYKNEFKVFMLEIKFAAGSRYGISGFEMAGKEAEAWWEYFSQLAAVNT